MRSKQFEIIGMSSVILAVVFLLRTAIVELGDSNTGTHTWRVSALPLVAHAGGAVTAENGDLVIGTNSLETLEYNYDLGFRVFEYDLNLTSDYELAAIHDWDQMNGEMTADEWLSRSFNGFTTMMLEDILDFMLIHMDVYLITDTKSFNYNDEYIQLQFQRIYDEAIRRSPILLDRIVPQIYDQNMYALVKDIYDFPSVIYTLYASPDTKDEVLEFIKDKPDIGTIVYPATVVEASFNIRLLKLGKLVYTHTINDVETMAKQLELGVHGFYTDLVTPDAYREAFDKR